MFKAEAKDENAFPMEKYMRNKFSFLGIKTPKRREVMRRFYKESEILKLSFQREFVLGLWDLKEREFQYAATDYIISSLKKLEKADILLIEKLIITKAWWDTVDMLAQRAVGEIAKNHPEVITEVIEGWIVSDNMWLQRSAILFQLKYKEDTDAPLLFRFIETHASSKEFFIQKAIGWALREYSKTNPQLVKNFIENNALSKLSIREGSKYLSIK
ncbi:DNA alkylation repair protein [Oceanobacillus sp. CAU 1775]